ncbi:hypothetical protein [Corynebacterium halotolerans]|uniref:hypothetical protein n=1 Tax=Corynebacterium halotolerans TaxID=225326 RepID=UPI003CF85076
MFDRPFDPATVELDTTTITVERTDDATVLNVPRSLSDFSHESRPKTLGGQLRHLARDWFGVRA